MNVFISEVCKTMGIPNAHTLNCCRTQGTIIDDSKVGFCITLPDGTAVEIYTPSETSEAAEEGFAYVPDYDIESPDMCAEDLGCWLDESLDCCRRIDAYYASLAGKSTNLNSKLDPSLASRIKNVFKAAQSAVDLPPGFRYTAFREVYDSVVSTLMYRSQKINEELWIIKSSLSCDDSEAPVDGPGVDDWAFRPNHDPESEGTILKHREGHFLDIENGQYNYTAEGETADKRDRKAAYWLAGLLSDLMDTVMTDPPARVYHLFLADGTAGISKSKLDSMSKPGLKNLIRRGLIDVEKVLKIKPELAKDLVRDKYITPEVVARRVPELLFWLVQNKYISPDYAVKIDPAIKDKLIRRGLYQVAENIPDDADAIIEGVKNGTFTATDAYRKNPKLLQTLVEQGLITPQEAYKLDASIVTWLLLNKYIGRKEAMKVKPDIQKYIARKYKDVNWEDLNASLDEDTTEVLTGELTDDALQSALTRAIEKNPDTTSVEVKVGDIGAFVAPAGYNDNEMIASGDLTNATVYVTLFKDYSIIRTESGSLDKRMKGSDAVNYIKQAAASYDMLHGDEDNLDASRRANSDTSCGANKGASAIDKLRAAFKKRQEHMKKAEDAADIKEAAGLNSSLSFNSDVSDDLRVEQSTPVQNDMGTDFAPYSSGYEKLADTALQGPGFVAECMLPEDDFDGIVVPGETEEIAKETLMQMLLANDGTFVDWKPIEDIQAFKAENPTGNYLVLN